MHTTPIISPYRKTTEEAKEFLQKFIEAKTLEEYLNYGDAFDVNDAPKQKATFADFKIYLKEHDPSWKHWNYSVQMKVAIVKGKIEKQVQIFSEINLLQAAIIKQDIDQVKFITSLALEKGQDNLDDLLKQEMKCMVPDDWELTSKFSWILDASSIHLATCCHVESLVHFLEVCSPVLRNIKTNQYVCTPLHVAASCNDETLATMLLIHKKANTEARNLKQQTPLHIASKCGFINTVIMLLFEGNADVMAVDADDQTPLCVAKTSKILDVLLSKTNAEKINGMSSDNHLFENIIRNHPASISTYLDLMVEKVRCQTVLFYIQNIIVNIESGALFIED